MVNDEFRKLGGTMVRIVLRRVWIYLATGNNPKCGNECKPRQYVGLMSKRLAVSAAWS